ncbi:hypothetical protein QFZ56_001400 [Streptomyces achromogenes]|uniref:Uncharacterized protein n=1 Tax=Streptomyces achromogenes TaxID=67255 RepID=A0ABU0PVP0_STRAH|nr:hypothetical protein [Streptomyces achromogenes]
MSRVIALYPAADTRASRTPRGSTVEPPPANSTTSPASAPATASAPPRPSRSPSVRRAPSAMRTGPAPRVTTVATASPVAETAAKYAVWKTARPKPVIAVRRALRRRARRRGGSGVGACPPRSGASVALADAGAYRARRSSGRAASSRASPAAQRQNDRATAPRSLIR